MTYQDANGDEPLLNRDPHRERSLSKRGEELSAELAMNKPNAKHKNKKLGA